MARDVGPNYGRASWSAQRNSKRWISGRCCRSRRLPFDSLAGRNGMTNLLRILGMLELASLVYAQPMQPSAATLAMQLGSGFESKFAQVNGTRLHYVRGGHGPAIILLHGFPEDWYEFR